MGKALALLALCLIAACKGAPLPARPVTITEAVDRKAASGQAAKSLPVWRPCPIARREAYHGNRWWGWIELCDGELRIELRAESIDLGGPGLSASALTRRCSSGKPASTGGNVPKAFFRATATEQVDQTKNLVRLTVNKIQSTCGGPFNANALFDKSFDGRFAEFADRYWRGLPEGKLAEALASQLEPD